jgi:hypothetical protein
MRMEMETKEHREGSGTESDTGTPDAGETPQSGLSVLRNIALYLLVPIGLILLVKVLTG